MAKQILPATCPTTPCTGRCSEEASPSARCCRPQRQPPAGGYLPSSHRSGATISISTSNSRTPSLMDKGQTVAYALTRQRRVCRRLSILRCKIQDYCHRQKEGSRNIATSKVGKVDDYAVIHSHVPPDYSPHIRLVATSPKAVQTSLACTDRKRHGSASPQAFPRVGRHRDETRQPHRQRTEHTSRHR